MNERYICMITIDEDIYAVYFNSLNELDAVEEELATRIAEDKDLGDYPAILEVHEMH